MFKKSFSKSIFPNFLLSLSLCPFFWLSGANEFCKFLIFLISALIIFFIFSIYNAVGQQVDQNYTASFSKNSYSGQVGHFGLENNVSSITPWKRQSCLFNTFNNNKIHFLFCNNTSKPPVLFVYSHYVLLIIFFLKKC